MSIKKWAERNFLVSANGNSEYSCVNPDTNAIQIINRIATGGGSVYVDNQNGVSTDHYLMKTEQGKTGNIVRPAPITRLFLTTDAASDLYITVIEITTDDMSFVFNSAQVVDIQGVVTVAEPISVDGNVDIGNTVSVDGSTVNIGTMPEIEIKNDSGNPVPITGSVGIAGTPTVNIGTVPEIEVKNDTGTPLNVAFPTTPTVNVGTVAAEIEVKNDAGNPLSVKGERGTYTAATTQTITAASTSQTVFAINTNRKALIITNTDATPGTILWVGFTTVTNSIVSRIPLQQYETIRFDGSDFVSTELVTIYSTTVGATFTAKEG